MHRQVGADYGRQQVSDAGLRHDDFYAHKAQVLKEIHGNSRSPPQNDCLLSAPIGRRTNRFLDTT